MNKDEVDLDRRSLETRRRRQKQSLRTLEERAAMYGMDVPLPLSNEIDFVKKEIQDIEEQQGELEKQAELEKKQAWYNGWPV